MKKILLSCLAIWMMFISGCGDPETWAEKTYNKAMALERAGGFSEAEPFYRDIVTKYPSTKTAAKVKEMLAKKKEGEEKK